MLYFNTKVKTLSNLQALIRLDRHRQEDHKIQEKGPFAGRMATLSQPNRVHVSQTGKEHGTRYPDAYWGVMQYGDCDLRKRLNVLHAPLGPTKC